MVTNPRPLTDSFSFTGRRHPHVTLWWSGWAKERHDYYTRKTNTTAFYSWFTSCEIKQLHSSVASGRSSQEVVLIETATSKFRSRNRNLIEAAVGALWWMIIREFYLSHSSSFKITSHRVSVDGYDEVYFNKPSLLQHAAPTEHMKCLSVKCLLSNLSCCRAADKLICVQSQ